MSGAAVHQDGRQIPADGKHLGAQQWVSAGRDGMEAGAGCCGDDRCAGSPVIAGCASCVPTPFPGTRSLILFILCRVQDSASATSAPNAASAPTATPSSPAAPSQPSTSSSAGPDAGSGSRRSSGSGTVGGPGDGGPNSAASILCKWGLGEGRIFWD